MTLPLHAPDERPPWRAGQPLLWLCRAASGHPRETGRQLLRCILGDYLEMAQPALRFDEGQAPRVAARWQGLELSLSLSYAGSLALIGICPGARIGVDITPVAPWPEMASLACLYLGPAGEATLAAAPASRRAGVFARLWAEMEARGKCLGIGLQEWSPEHGRQLDQAGLRLRSIEHAGHAVAMATPGPPETRDFRQQPF